MKKNSFLNLASSMVIATVLAGCNGHDCAPGSLDGAWELLGNEPPAANNIQTSLIGMNLADADRFITSNGFTSGENKRTWIFERRKTMTYRTCLERDVVSYRQDLLVVEAAVDDGQVTSCTISRRGALSELGWVDQKQIISGPANPLDGEVLHCLDNDNDNGHTK